MARPAEGEARALLLRAAEDVFAERGVDGAEIDEIVRRAGLTQESFHHHFDSKEQALDEIVQNWINACASLFADPSEYPEVSDDPGAMLDFVIERDLVMFEFFWRTRTTLKLLRTWRSAYAELLDSFRNDMQRRTQAWLEGWRRDGLIRADVDVSLAATLMGGAYEQLTVRVIRQDERPPLQTWLEAAQETFMRAYGTAEIVAALEGRRKRYVSGFRAAYTFDPAAKR